jgi:hypothetical protein
MTRAFYTVSGAVLLFLTAGSAFASPVPEIDGGLASQAITLLGGAYLLFKGAKR